MSDLLQIQTAAGAADSAIRLHPSDNVAIAHMPVAPGSEIRVDEFTMEARSAIPPGHKIALREIAPGEAVLRYGCSIGKAAERIAAGGVNLIAFTTGRGSAIGFLTVPVLKISSNTTVYDQMRDNIDLNAGTIMDGSATVAEIGQAILARLLEVASGALSASELLEHREFVPWRIGPVL